MQVAFSQRFFGLFWTQLLGAFQDNVFKNALLILIVYHGFGHSSRSSQELSEMASAVFIFPFFVCSGTAGQLADKYDKADLVRRLKWIELLIALFAALGFFMESLPLLFIALGALGVQAAFFGPLKYGIIPQLLSEEDLVEGNAVVETGTKLAILIGTLIGGFLADSAHAVPIISGTMFLVALLGILSARSVPSVEACDPGMQVQWNPIGPTWSVIKKARQNKSVFLSILGISWFWALGGSLLTLVPAYGKEVLRVDPQVVTVILSVFSVGVEHRALLQH